MQQESILHSVQSPYSTVHIGAPALHAPLHPQPQPLRLDQPVIPSQIDTSIPVMISAPSTSAVGDIAMNPAAAGVVGTPGSHTVSLPATQQIAVAAAGTGVGAGGGLQQRKKLSGRYALSDFSVERTLGTGSFGRVHLVRSRHNGRFYAVKVRHRCGAAKSSALGRK